MKVHKVLIGALDERLSVARPVDFHYVFIVDFVGADFELRESVHERVQHEQLLLTFGLCDNCGRLVSIVQRR